MRIRLATHPPLPPLKAWYGITPELTEQTVSELKEDIVTGLLARSSSADIKLEIDGFQLLDESLVGTVIQNGDLVEWVLPR